MGTFKEKSSKKYVWLSAMVVAGLSPLQSAFAGATTCVQTAISITMLTTATKLDFATIMACIASGGTIKINETTGARTTTGCNEGLAGSVARPRIRIKGNQAGAGVKIKVTITNANSATITTGTKTMAVTGIKMKQGTPTYSFNGNQTKTITVGGTLNYSANQTGGSYSGTFTLNAVCI